MMVDVHMADGRTVFRALARNNVVRLFTANLDELDSGRPERLWVNHGDHGPDERDPFLVARHGAGDQLPAVWRDRLGLAGAADATPAAAGAAQEVARG